MPSSFSRQSNWKTSQPYDRLDVEEPRWFAVRVGHKKERLTIQQLLRKGVEAYTPLMQEKRHYQKCSPRTVHFAVLPGYIFVRIIKRQELLVYENPQVFGFVKTGRERCDVPKSDIEILRLICLEQKANWTLSPDLSALENGRRLRLVGGPLSGLIGSFVKKKNTNIFVIRIDSIGHELEVEVDGKYLKVEPDL